MQSLISRLNQSRVFLFLYIFAAAALLSSCGQLPLLSNPVVPPTARNGQLVPVSVDLDPKNFASRDVIFRYGGQGIGSNQALTCRPLPGSSVLRCSTQIRFTRTGAYDYDFLYTYQLNRSDVEIMVPQPVGTIRILPNPGSPGTGIVSGGDDTLFDPAAIVEAESPLNGSACVGDPITTINPVPPRPEDQPGADFRYQIGVHAGKTIRLVLALQTRFGPVPVSEITFQTVR